MIGIGHPRQAHFWKNIIHNLMDDGHDVEIVAWKKDILLDLLNAYGFEYEVIGTNYKGLIKKAYGMFENDIKLFKIAKKFKPDILMGGSPYLAHVSKLIGKPYIYFFETDHAHISYWLTYPFANTVCSPSCLQKNINPKKYVSYNGYSYLTYLHPDYFTPDPSVLDDLGLAVGDKFIVLRFVAWASSHDIGDRGFSDRKEVVRTLEQYGIIFITSETELPDELKKYKITTAPEKIHHLLHFASLYMGESAPMAAESAILGTPAIFISTSRRSYTDELESKYDLLYTFSGSSNTQEKAIEKALELLEDENTKNRWKIKQERFIGEKIDVIKFITEFIEEYPESFEKYKQRRDA